MAVQKERSGGRGYRAVVIGGSAGGMEALKTILRPLTASFPLPILVVQHLHRTDEGRFAEHMDSDLGITVREAEDKELVQAGRVYVAPADYHLLVERNETLSLSVDPKVNWSRPSIDVLFESAARSWADGLIAIILSGASEDGARGMQLVQKLGGLCIAQDPRTAESSLMPQAAIRTAGIRIVLAPDAIARELLRMTCSPVSDPGNGRRRGARP